MQFVKASVSLIPQPADFEGMKKHIELCGRVSYKSEDRITDESCDKFIQMLADKGHTSACEHGTIYLTIPNTDEFKQEIDSMLKLRYTDVVTDEDNVYVTTNYRVIINNHIPMKFVEDFWSEPTKHIKRVSFRVVCSRGIGYELVRHRVMSFTQESTRYCNYSKDKHGGCLKFIIPTWLDDIKEGETFSVEDVEPEALVKTMLSGEHTSKTMILASVNVCIEKAYMELLSQGCTPQQARDILPNGLKTELIITGTVPQWEHLLSLRSPAFGAKGMHPDIAVIGDNIYYALVSGGYLKEVKKDD